MEVANGQRQGRQGRFRKVAHKKVAVSTCGGTRCPWQAETVTCRGKRRSRTKVWRYWIRTLRSVTVPAGLKLQWRTRHTAAWQCWLDKTGVLICLVRLAGIEPTTLGFGGHAAEPWGAAPLLQLLDSTAYSNWQQMATVGRNGKKIAFLLPQNSPHLSDTINLESCRA